jgi:hypothetical protein
MIETDQRYKATMRRMAEFEEALAHIEDRAAERDPLFHRVLRKNIEEELQTMYEQLAEYEARQHGGSLMSVLTAGAELPLVLIRARIAAGLRQADLAAGLGLGEDEIRQHEATRFAGVAPERLRAIAAALGVSFLAEPPVSDVHRAGRNRTARTA